MALDSSVTPVKGNFTRNDIRPFGGRTPKSSARDNFSEVNKGGSEAEEDFTLPDKPLKLGGTESGLGPLLSKWNRKYVAA